MAETGTLSYCRSSMEKTEIMCWWELNSLTRLTSFLSSWLTYTLTMQQAKMVQTASVCPHMTSCTPHQCHCLSFHSGVVCVYTWQLLTLYGAVKWIKRKSLSVITLWFSIDGYRRQHRAATAAAHTGASALGSGVSADFHFYNNCH